MKSESIRKYRAHLLNSHLDGTSTWLDSLPLWHLGVWLLTWPGIRAIAFTGPVFTYVSEGGMERTTAVTATAVLHPSRVVYFTLSEDTDEQTAAIKAQRAHANRLGAGLRVLSINDLYSNRTELSNRRDMHMFLYQAHGLKTTSWESRVLHEAQRHPRALGRIADAVGLTWEQACVGFLKCWMMEKLEWSITQLPLSPLLVVSSKER
jgi:hypothetical protein